MEFVRHRVFSFAQESTRYCNYSKEEYGNNLTFILPPWVEFKEGIYVPTLHNYAWLVNGQTEILLGMHRDTEWLKALSTCELSYLKLMSDEKLSGSYWIAQQARDVLPNSLKTELVMTGTMEQWEGFFKLRCDAAAHPQARELAIPLEEVFQKIRMEQELGLI